MNIGGTAQACANMTYTNPTANTQVCGAGTDAYGTSPSNYTSCVPANATMNSTTGVLTGVAAGSTNISVTAGIVHGGSARDHRKQQHSAKHLASGSDRFTGCRPDPIKPDDFQGEKELAVGIIKAEQSSPCVA